MSGMTDGTRSGRSLLALIVQYGEECVEATGADVAMSAPTDADRVLQQIKNRLAVLPAQAVNTIVSDLQGRAGLGDEWDDIDEDTQEEIADAWAQAIRNALDRPLK